MNSVHFQNQCSGCGNANSNHKRLMLSWKIRWLCSTSSSERNFPREMFLFLLCFPPILIVTNGLYWSRILQKTVIVVINLSFVYHRNCTFYNRLHRCHQQHHHHKRQRRHTPLYLPQINDAKKKSFLISQYFLFYSSFHHHTLNLATPTNDNDDSSLNMMMKWDNISLKSHSSKLSSAEIDGKYHDGQHDGWIVAKQIRKNYSKFME